MKKTINSEYELQSEFAAYNRDYYSIEGYAAMLEYCDECMGEEMELDVIALCGSFSEYDTKGLLSDYNYLLDEEEEYQDDDEKAEAIVSELVRDYAVIELSGSWLVIE